MTKEEELCHKFPMFGSHLLALKRKHYNAWKLKKSLAELRQDYYEPTGELQQQANFQYEEYIKIQKQIEHLTKNENNQSTIT